MLVDDTTLAEGTETETTEGTSTAASDDSASSFPSFDWEAVKAHPEYKTHVKSTLEADEEFRKEAARGVRLTDVEKRAQERANEISAADKKRADDLQERLDRIEAEREQALLSTMTYDEQQEHALNKRLTEAEAKVARYETERNVAEAAKAVDEIIGYAMEKWGLNKENAEKLRDSSDTIDLMDRAMQAAAAQWSTQAATTKALKTKNEAQERILNGTSTFAATGSAAAGGEMSDDDVADAYSKIGPSHPNYAAVAKRYAEVYNRRGY